MSIIGNDRVRNEEVLHKVKQRKITHNTKWRKANWTGHILRRNCLLKHVIEWTIEGGIGVKEMRRRCKQPVNDLKEKRGYWKLKEKAPDRTLWRLILERLWTCLKTRYGKHKRVNKSMHRFALWSLLCNAWTKTLYAFNQTRTCLKSCQCVSSLQTSRNLALGVKMTRSTTVEVSWLRVKQARKLKSGCSDLEYRMRSTQKAPLTVASTRIARHRNRRSWNCVVAFRHAQLRCIPNTRIRISPKRQFTTEFTFSIIRSNRVVQERPDTISGADQNTPMNQTLF